MILDHLSRSELYYHLDPRLKLAWEFLQNNDPLALPLGRTTVDGDYVFALTQEYVPREESECRLEAHRRYFDIQYVASGEEKMGWAALEGLEVTEPYSEERDVAFFQGTCELLLVKAGFFTVFSPHDVHKPMVRPTEDATQKIRKIVMKVQPYRQDVQVLS